MAKAVSQGRQKPSRARKTRAGTDNLCKMLAELYPEDIASWVLGRDVKQAKILKTELPIEPIRADFVVLIDADDEILHIEFQSEPKSEPPINFRMLDYFVRLYRIYRKPIRQVVILLKETGVEVSTEFRSGRTLHQYEALKMWKQNANTLLSREPLLPFAVLCKTASPAKLLQAVAEKVNVIEPADKRQTLSGWIQLMAGIRFDEGLIESFFKGGIMRESVIYQKILREGEQEGFKKGEQKGEQKGLQKGLEHERSLLIRQLTRLIGKPGVKAQRQIENLSFAQLDELGEVLFDFKDKKDLAGWLDIQTVKQ